MKGAVFVDLNRKSREKRNLNSGLKAHINREHIKYIATRDGVEIGSQGHGLFGVIDSKYKAEDMKLKDITDIFSNVNKNEVEIIKSVISLSEEDALKYGYNNKEKWQELVNIKVREIAKEYGIKYSNLNFIAAFHPKEENPHCHLVFFDKSELEYKKKRKYVSYEKIRAELNKEVYSEDLSKLYKIQNEAKKSVKFGLSDICDKDISEISEEQYLRNEINIYTPFNTPAKLFSNKINETEINLLNDKISDFLINNKDINYRYKFLTEQQKREVDDITRIIIKTSPDIRKQFQNYIDSTVQIAKIIYPNNVKENEKRKERAKEEIEIKISNQFLKAIKEEKFKGSIREYNASKEGPTYKNMGVNKFLNFQNFLSDIFYSLQNENKRLNAHKNLIDNKFSSLSKQARREKIIENKNSGSIDWSR